MEGVGRMCGIAGVVRLSGERIPDVERKLAVMSRLLAHRGPDGEGTWIHDRGHVGFAHRRLAILDLLTGQQPMSDPAGNWVTYNGEIYNYVELRDALGAARFATTSDTEVLLRAYEKWGEGALTRFRGMFAFALWDEARDGLFCARDRFGIKPLYYAVVDDELYLASEVKALLPFLPAIDTHLDALKDYLTFQFCLAGKTLFEGVDELQPGHVLTVRRGVVETHRYWDVYFEPDFDHTDRHFREHVRALIEESVALHLRADVPVGAYVSGGLDSSAVAALAASESGGGLLGFTGKFTREPGYDESSYARELAAASGIELHEVDISADDFVAQIDDVVYHLDFPVAGPGSFPQFVVSQLASQHRKVLLGGQGGDEIFGGYTRYLIAYFEQCIRGAIDGTMHSGNFVVTYESIIPNLTALREYRPLLQEFWREGLFEDLDRRYFRLINRASDLGGEINWDLLGDYSPYETFAAIFRGNNLRHESYFDVMTHFDFKTLLPALLHVEDRVSMAHGLESRVPLLDHRIVELAATIPADIKFTDGRMKRILKEAIGSVVPEAIANRTDKMGFPVPLHEWLAVPGTVRDFVFDMLSSDAALGREVVDNRRVIETLGMEPKFDRRVWGLLCLELWQQTFHDRSAYFSDLLRKEAWV
jgi:asparagine synthase (glutamine-hydrolysing)